MFNSLYMSFIIGVKSLVVLPLILVFNGVSASAVFAVVFTVQKQWGCHCCPPLQHLTFRLAVGQGVLVLQICCWVTLERIRNEAKVPFFVLLEAHWYHTWEKEMEGKTSVWHLCHGAVTRIWPTYRNKALLIKSKQNNQSININMQGVGFNCLKTHTHKSNHSLK